jgi:peptidoglycan hydrolase CwlO-like protein
MTDNTTNLVFEILKSIQADIRDIRSKQDETLIRITQLETAMLSVKREIAYALLIETLPDMLEAMAKQIREDLKGTMQ